MEQFTMVDLFAGTGAFSYAFNDTGHVKCVFANDMVEPSKKIYDINFDEELKDKDVKKEITVIPFKKESVNSELFSDSYFKMARVAEEQQKVTENEKNENLSYSL